MRRRPLFFWILTAACFAGCAAAGLPDNPVLKPYALTEVDFPLKSGLRVLVQEDHSAPVVALVSAYTVGSSADPKGREGLAHLIEHLAFRTHFVDGVPIWDHIKHMGAEFNATTQWDFTNYYTIIPKAELKHGLQIEAWRLGKILDGVTPEVFATEREVVRQEHRLGSETGVGGKVFDLLAGALFPPGYSLSRPIGGTHDAISAMTLDDAKAFVKEHYKPENCTIVIAGDVDVNEVRAMLGSWPAEILFGPGGPNGPAVKPNQRMSDRATLPVPPPVSRTMMRDKGPVPLPELYLAWSAPGGRRHNDTLLQFVAERLNLALEEGIEFKEDDDIEGVFAFAEPNVDGSMFVVSATLKPGSDPEKARARILDALVKTWTTELGTAQAEAVRWRAATSTLLNTSQLASNAIELAFHLAATGSATLYKDDLEELAKVKPGDVTDLAYRYLGRDRAVSLYMQPENEAAAKLVGGKGGTATAAAAHDVGHDTTKATGDLSPARILQIAPSPGLALLPRWKLSNGLEVVAARHGSAPVAEIVVGTPGGFAVSQPYGLASYASTFMTSKCHDYGSLMPVGGRIGRSMGQTSSQFTVSVLSGNLSNGVAVLSDQVSCLEANEEYFLEHEQFLAQSTRTHERVMRMPDVIAAVRMWKELYPNHPWGVIDIDPAKLKGVTFEDIAGYVRAHYRPGNSVAVMVGDIDPNEVKTLADKYLTRWSGGAGGTSTPPAPPPPPAARKAFLVDRPGATQAEVTIACRLADATPETLSAFDVTGALANERAWLVREEWGASYGVYARAATMPGGAAHMLIGGAIETRYVGRSVTRLLDILAELSSDRLSEDLFLVKRWDVARQFSGNFATGGRIANEIVRASENGWPADVWDRYPERLAATTRASVRAVMKDCVGHEIISVAGNAKELRPQLEAAGLTLEAN